MPTANRPKWDEAFQISLLLKQHSSEHEELPCGITPHRWDDTTLVVQRPAELKYLPGWGWLNEAWGKTPLAHLPPAPLAIQSSVPPTGNTTIISASLSGYGNRAMHRRSLLVVRRAVDLQTHHLAPAQGRGKGFHAVCNVPTGQLVNLFDVSGI